MMHVRCVWMRVFRLPMLMDVGMGFARRIGLSMSMLVMTIMDVWMRVNRQFVDVFMLVSLGKMQPHADGQEHAGNGQLQACRIAQCDHGGKRAQKWCGREIGAGARRSEFAQRKNEEDQADAISDEAHGHRDQRGD